MSNGNRPELVAVARGVGRMSDEQRALLVSFDRIPTDDDIRAVHETLRAAATPLENPPADAPLSVHLRGLARSMWPQDAIRPLLEKCADALVTAERARKVVDQQAEDGPLWIVPIYLTEDMLQKALRRLHEAVEGKTSEQCARETLAKVRT